MSDEIAPARCVGLAGALFGHHFEPRVTVNSVPAGAKFSGGGLFPDDMLKLLDAHATHTRTYHGDVCRRCGQVVNRPAP